MTVDLIKRDVDRLLILDDDGLRVDHDERIEEGYRFQELFPIIDRGTGTRRTSAEITALVIAWATEKFGDPDNLKYGQSFELGAYIPLEGGELAGQYGADQRYVAMYGINRVKVSS